MKTASKGTDKDTGMQGRREARKAGWVLHFCYLAQCQLVQEAKRPFFDLILPN